jgi:hypothetical protein
MHFSDNIGKSLCSRRLHVVRMATILPGNAPQRRSLSTNWLLVGTSDEFGRLGGVRLANMRSGGPKVFLSRHCLLAAKELRGMSLGLPAGGGRRGSRLLVVLLAGAGVGASQEWDSVLGVQDKRDFPL